MASQRTYDIPLGRNTTPAAAKADVCAGAGQGLTRQEWATYIPGVPYRAPC